MGNHSSRTEEDEEIDHNPYQIIHPQSSNQTTLTRKLVFFFPISIYKITKYLLQKLWRKREKPDPLLPTQNPKTNRHSPHIPPHSKPAGRTFQYQTGRVERPTPVWTRPVSSEEEKGKKKEGVVVVPTVTRYSPQIPPTAVAADQKFQIQTGRVVKSTPGSVVGKRETKWVVPTCHFPQIAFRDVVGDVDPKPQFQTGRVVKSTPGSVVGKRETEGVVPTRHFPQIASPVVVDVDPKPQFQTGRVVKLTPGFVVGKRGTEGAVLTRHFPQIASPAVVVDVDPKPQFQTGRVVKSTPGSVVGKRGTEGAVLTRHFPQIASPAVVVDVDPKPQFQTGRVIKTIPGNPLAQILPPPAIALDYKFQPQTGAKSSSKKGEIKHYSNRHRILVVGDGDFSFSVTLAVVFESAANMIATSKDSIGYLWRNYAKAPSNMNELEKRGCKVMNEIDATIMANHELLGRLKFDRIVYNFPYAGFIKRLPRSDQLRLHKELVNDFLKNAKQMLSENGEIHISHKENSFHNEWGLDNMASCHQLKLIEAVVFDRNDYPGYHPKYGFGGDKNFNCDPSKTYKFRHNWVKY